MSGLVCRLTSNTRQRDRQAAVRLEREGAAEAVFL
jgi:hypothetical protein